MVVRRSLAASSTPNARQHAVQRVGGRGLVERDADRVGVDHAHVDTLARAAAASAVGVPGDAERDGVEERIVAHVEPTRAQTVGERDT